jgi:hypothetical protein
LISTYATLDWLPSLVGCVFLDGPDQDCHLAKRRTLIHSDWREQFDIVGEGPTEALESRARRTMRSCYRGLIDVINLETPAAADAHQSRHGEGKFAPIVMSVELSLPRRIGVAHRSVLDFLNREDAKEGAQSFLGSLDEHNIMSQAVLAELHCTDCFISHPLYCVD